ncbi:transposable element Tcb1 transposase [Trichonephila clavipes]|nr:transposable element Tcb1 transposase [Trichonephila clavipes]
MTAQRYVHDILPSHVLSLMQRQFFNKTMLGLTRTASRAFHEFERTRGKVTANMERNVSKHHTELLCVNARSYRIVHSR